MSTTPKTVAAAAAARARAWRLPPKTKMRKSSGQLHLMPGRDLVYLDPLVISVLRIPHQTEIPPDHPPYVALHTFDGGPIFALYPNDGQGLYDVLTEALAIVDKAKGILEAAS